MQGLVLSQVAHVVPDVYPVDLNGGKTGVEFNMAKYGHASIIVSIGASSGTPTMTIEECDDSSGSNPVAIPFNVWKSETTDGDVLAAKTAVTSSGFAIAASTARIFYVVELDARALDDKKNWVRVKFSNPSASVLGSVVVVLSGSRYAHDQSETVVS